MQQSLFFGRSLLACWDPGRLLHGSSKVTGDEALRIEKQSDLKTKKDVMDALRKMYGNTIPEATGK